MSNNEITINIGGNQRGHKTISLNISYTNAINKIWYILYKIDQIILTNDNINDNIHNKICDTVEESFDDNNNYLEYIIYKLSNSNIPNIVPGIYRGQTGIVNYSDFVDYISYVSHTCLPRRSQTGVSWTNDMTFTYDFDKPQSYNIKLRVYGFNQLMYNTTYIHKLINNKEEDNVLVKDNTNTNTNTRRYSISK